MARLVSQDSRAALRVLEDLLGYRPELLLRAEAPRVVTWLLSWTHLPMPVIWAEGQLGMSVLADCCATAVY